LYGHAVPQTVANFIEAVREGVYTSTTFNRILPGAYIQVGLGRLTPCTASAESLALRLTPQVAVVSCERLSQNFCTPSNGPGASGHRRGLLAE
jgi:hypothetical protein